MRVETFDEYLNLIGKNNCAFLKNHCKLLRDNKTYLIDEILWDDILADILHDTYPYNGHKCLVLTDGNDHVVGGVLFYGGYDIQIQVLDEYKGQGYMSAIHKNGILNDCLYKNQICTIEFSAIKSQEDLDMKLHLLSYLDVVIHNLDSLKDWFDISKVSTRNMPKE